MYMYINIVYIFYIHRIRVAIAAIDSSSGFVNATNNFLDEEISISTTYKKRKKKGEKNYK